MAATGDAHLLDARTKLTFWCVFAVYSLTAAPSVAGGDSGELLAEACGLGTAHPPGYPLFTMVMHPVLRLPRVFFAPTPAAWANLFTAAVAAAAAAVVGACVDEARWSAKGADASKLPGLVGAGLFAFSPVTWQYAGTAEVFALNNLFAALLVHRALRYARLRQPADLTLGAFLVGVALTNQHTAVLFAVPLVAWLLSICGRELGAGDWFRLVAAGLAGLSPYAYLPLGADSRGSWGDVRSLAGFARHFLRKDYGTLQLYSGRGGGGESLGDRLAAYAHSVHALQGPATAALPLLAAAGAVALALAEGRAAAAAPDDEGAPRGKQASKYRRRARVQAYNEEKKGVPPERRRAAARDRAPDDGPAGSAPRDVAAALAGTLGFYLVVFHALSNLPLSDPLLYGIHARFWMQPHVLVCCFAGLGVDGAARAAGAAGGDLAKVAVAGPLALLLLLGQLRAGLEPPGAAPGAPGGLYGRLLGLQAAAPAWYFHDYARALLAPLPERALLLVNYDQQWTSVRYQQRCEGFRDDVTVINLSMMTYGWWATKRELYPDLGWPGTHYTKEHTVAWAEGAFTIGEFFDANFWNRSGIFLGGKLSYADADYKERYEFLPMGLLSQLSRVDRPPAIRDYVADSREFWNATLAELKRVCLDPAHCSTETWEWTIQREAFDHVAERAAYVLESAMKEEPHDPALLLEAAVWFEHCAAYDANMSTPSTKNLGLAHVHLVRSTKAPGPLPFVPDPVGAAGILHAAGGEPFAALHPGAATPEWKAWASARFQAMWGEFLARPDATNDAQYDTIKDLYTKVVTAGGGKR